MLRTLEHCWSNRWLVPATLMGKKYLASSLENDSRLKPNVQCPINKVLRIHCVHNQNIAQKLCPYALLIAHKSHCSLFTLQDHTLCTVNTVHFGNQELCMINRWPATSLHCQQSPQILHLLHSSLHTGSPPYNKNVGASPGHRCKGRMHVLRCVDAEVDMPSTFS